jgi:hypothetical protein
VHAHCSAACAVPKSLQGVQEGRLG